MGDENMKAADTARSGALVTPEQLRSELDDPELLLVDARSVCQYAAGHLPGAIHLDILNINLSDTRKEAYDSFMTMMGGLLPARGIDPGRRIVVYEDTSGFRAARLFWFCRYLGTGDVRVLDGGLGLWTAAGYPRSGECVSAKPVKCEIRPVPGLGIGVDELHALLEDPDTLVLDTRGPEEHAGRDVRAARGGAIPGSVNVEYTRALGPDGAYLPSQALRDLYTKSGVTPEKTIVTYCQTGYRSSHTFLALQSLGYPRVRNYIGSWKEWGDRPDLPIVGPGK